MVWLVLSVVCPVDGSSSIAWGLISSLHPRTTQKRKQENSHRRLNALVPPISLTLFSKVWTWRRVQAERFRDRTSVC